MAECITNYCDQTPLEPITPPDIRQCITVCNGGTGGGTVFVAGEGIEFVTNPDGTVTINATDGGADIELVDGKGTKAVTNTDGSKQVDLDLEGGYGIDVD